MQANPYAIKFLDWLHEQNGTEYVFTMEQGRKYAKIIQQHHRSRHRSVHAFVDAVGNVYKPAGWKAPAKGVRFNMNDDLTGMWFDPYGGYLYKNPRFSVQRGS